jgi:hypothetical protein
MRKYLDLRTPSPPLLFMEERAGERRRIVYINISIILLASRIPDK